MIGEFDELDWLFKKVSRQAIDVKVRFLQLHIFLYNGYMKANSFPEDLRVWTSRSTYPDMCIQMESRD